MLPPMVFVQDSQFDLADPPLRQRAIASSSEPGIVGDWLGAPMFFSQYDAGTTLELVGKAGFEIVRQAAEAQLEGEHEVTYLWVLAQKARPRNEGSL